MAAVSGSTLTLKAEGEDAEEAVDRMINLIAREFKDEQER
jgi:phosphotransferase system HPr-like phosphotransfer protein